MKKKNGFTLIELLAVIVILAIIALIATPILLNIITDARKNSFKRSAEGVLKSAKLDYSKDLLSGEISKKIYVCSNNKCITTIDGKQYELPVEGNFGEGEVGIENDGRIAFSLTNGSYCVVKFYNSEKIELIDGECDNVDISETTDTPNVLITSTITSNSISLSVNATSETGIKGYSYKIDDGEFSEISLNNAKIYDKLVQDSTHTIKVRVYNKLPNKIGYDERVNMKEETLTLTTSSVISPTITIVPNDNAWMLAKKIIIDYKGGNENADLTGITSTYRIIKTDSTEVQAATEGTEVVVTENDLCIVAENRDINNNFTPSVTTCIDNIDRSEMSLSTSISQTSNSIKVTAVGSANSGIYEYRFSINDGQWVAPDEIGENVAIKTFNKLTTGTYTVKTKIISNARNNTALNEQLYNEERDANVGIKIKEDEVVLNGCSVPTITFANNNGNTWTQTKTVNITKPSNTPSTFKLEYTTIAEPTDSDWVEGTSKKFTADGSIMARLTDGTNICSTLTQVVDKIDTTAPTNVEATITNQTLNSVTVKAIGTDEDSDIYGYKFSKDNGSTWTSIQSKGTNNDTYTFSGLSYGTYNIKVKAVNNAWNNESGTKNDSMGTKDSTLVAVELLPSYNPGEQVTVSGYHWRVIGIDGNNLILLMEYSDAATLAHPTYNHCTNDKDTSTDCGVSGSYYQYSWDKSLIRAYLNGDFYNSLDSATKNDLVATRICADPSMQQSNAANYSYGGYTEAEIAAAGKSCSSYVSDKVRLITITEYHNLTEYSTFKNASYPATYNNMTIPNLSYITRISDNTSSTWLYSSSAGNWWTMNSYSYSSASYIRNAYYIQTNGNMNSATAHTTTYKVRPVIVIKNSSSVSSTPKYTVTFETNGGSTVAAQTVYEGGKATNKSTSKSGYTFNGWYTDSTLRTSYNFNTPVTSNLTLYAKFTRNTPTPTTTTTTTTTTVATNTNCCSNYCDSYCMYYLTDASTYYGCLSTCNSNCRANPGSYGC